MSVFVQEVLSLLKRNFVKTSVNPTDDYFQFVRKGAFSRAKASAGGFAPQGQSLLISAGSWLCSQTGPKGLGRFASVVKESGEAAGTIPMFWLKQGQCNWHSLKDSLLSQDTADPIIYVGRNNAPTDLRVSNNLTVSNKVFIPQLQPNNPFPNFRGQVVFADIDGELKTNDSFTFTNGNNFLVNGAVNTSFGTVTSGASSPPTSTRVNNKLILSGPVYDAASGGGGTGLPNIGQVLIAREDLNFVDPVGTVGTIVGGSNYATGTAVATTPTPAGGTGCTLDITAPAGAITAVVVNAVGTGYSVGDVLAIAGGAGGSVTVATIGVSDGRVEWGENGGAVTNVAALTNQSIWVGDSNNIAQELPIGSTGQTLQSNGGLVGWATSVTIGGLGSLYRLAMFTPNGSTIADSLLVQDGDALTPATTVANDGYLKLNLVDKLNLVEKVMVWDDVGTAPNFTDKNQVKFRDANSIGLTGTATLRRVPLWSPDGLNLQSSLLIQSDMIQPPANYPVVDPNFIAQILTNNGSFINEGILTLKTVVNDNDLLKILVLAADDEVKYRDLSSLPFGTIGGGGTHKRLPLWTPDGTTIKDSLLSQDNDVQPGSGGFSAQVLTNDGSLQQTKEIFLDSVPQDDTLTEVLVRDPASANQVKFRNVTTISPSVGFDTLTMSTTADWNQTFLNAYISLDDTTVPYRSIKGMTTLTDGQTGVVIAENVKQGTLLADDAIRFPNGWGTPGNLYDNRISWAAGFNNGYPTSTLLYGESLKFKYSNYEIAGGGFAYKYVLYWESCCKLYSLNTCPVASNANFTANEDNPISQSVASYVVDDAYGQYPGVYTASALADPAAGTLVFNSSTGAFTFTPTANYNGSTTFTYTYNDGYCESNTATVTLNILPVAEEPIWTSQDPVTANTYPNLLAGDAWTYTWTTADADDPCASLVYTIRVNDGTTLSTIYTSAGGQTGLTWLTFTPDNPHTCTGTLAGTYPATAGAFQVIMTVEDPSGNFDTQTFTIGGLLVSQDTYFVFYSDTSGSMVSTIRETAQMSSVATVKCKGDGSNQGTTTLVLVSGGVVGKVNAVGGTTDDSFLCVRDGMNVSGTGITAGTTVVSGGGSTPSGGTLTLTLSNNHTASEFNILTFTLTDLQKETDYNNANNFRNLLQDFYATGQTYAQETAAGAAHNPATNGQNKYESHLYWYHSGNERPLGYLGFRAQGGATFATIGSGGNFPNADQIVVMAWGDESSEDAGTIGSGVTYRAGPETGANTWADRGTQPNPTTNQNIGTDCINTRGFIQALETAAGNNTIYRGIAFRVISNVTNELEEIMGPGGYAQTGGLNSNGYNTSYNPQPSNLASPPGAYNSATTSLADMSNIGGTGSGSPIRITYSGNVSNNPSNGSIYYYALVKTELNAIGFNL
tara:strand:+ start:2638 stop:6843 length:4206 start_codon:yes stop_codon:yes gene_type:complete